MLTINTMLTIRNNGSKRFIMSSPLWGRNALAMVTGLPAFTVDTREIKSISHIEESIDNSVKHNKLPW